ncbi:MAG: AMP-dependent synthetase/ligase [Pseudomonadota bacterium]
MQLATNLVQLFHDGVGRRGDRPYLWRRTPDGYVPTTWNEVAEQVALLARALREAGVQAGDRVVIVAENRPEWLIADLAALTLGAVTVPAYTTNTVRDHQFILSHSGASAVFYSGAAVARTLLPAIREVGTIRTIVAIEPPDDAADLPIFSYATALERGAAADATPFAMPAPHDLACIIYTSGTGGQPKGVMLSHANMLANVDGSIDLLEELGVGDDEVFLSFLPLSHSYEHTAGQFVPMGIGAQVYYAEGVDTLSQNLGEARPTILTCVPRLYEVMRQRILAGVNRAGGTKAWLFKKAVEIGTKRYEKQPLAVHERLLDLLLDRLVRTKVNERFGGRLKAMVSGGAPLNYDVGVFFAALGLPIFQGYGQTEASPVISANRPKRHKLKSVGLPLRGVEIRIAEDGEILVRGNLVMKGYWQDDAATASTLIDGWLHTGDVGSIDDEGFLSITGRKKEMIVNSGGDNISPQRVEGVLSLEPEIGQVLVYGDRRPHLVALVVPDADFLKAFATSQGVEADLTAIADNPELRKAVGAAITRANAELSVIEKVRRFEIMGEPFTIENGTMTPTLKLRRPIIVERHQTLFEQLYEPARAA